MPALPAEKSVTTPAGQPRTTRLRRHEQHPRLIPAPGVTFADLGVPAPLVAALAEDGITVPFPVQAAVLPDALAGLSAAVIRIGEHLGWATSVHWPVPGRLDSRRRGRGKPEPALQPGGRRTERAAASRRSPLPASGDRIR